MPLDRNELLARIAKTSPSDMLRGTVFRAIVQHVERALPEGDPRVRAVRRHYNRSAVSDLFNYPVSDWLGLLWIACDALEPLEGSSDAALRRVGRAVADSFLSSVVGRLAISMAAGKKPMELLFHAPAVYASGASYGKRTPVRHDERHGVIQIREDYAPAEYHVGIMQHGLGVNGHQIGARAKVYGLFEYDIEVEWLP